MAAVAVKLVVVLATSPYDNDQMREREVGDAIVVASYGRARSSAALGGHSGDGDVKCGFTHYTTTHICLHLSVGK